VLSRRRGAGGKNNKAETFATTSHTNCILHAYKYMIGKNHASGSPLTFVITGSGRCPGFK
jgi:hypothetical protein